MSKKPEKPDSGSWIWDEYKAWIRPLPPELYQAKNGCVIARPTEASNRYQQFRHRARAEKDSQTRGRER